MSQENKQQNNPETSISIVRKFNTSVKRLYEAWTRPEQITQWIGPGEVSCKQAEIDLCVGGSMVIHMVSESGDHVIEGKYIEVVPEEKLQFTWNWRNSDGPETLVTIMFAEREGMAELTLKHENFATREAAESHRYGHSGGLDKLEKFFEQERKATQQ